MSLFRSYEHNELVPAAPPRALTPKEILLSKISIIEAACHSENPNIGAILGDFATLCGDITKNDPANAIIQTLQNFVKTETMEKIDAARSSLRSGHSCMGALLSDENPPKPFSEYILGVCNKLSSEIKKYDEELAAEANFFQKHCVIL